MSSIEPFIRKKNVLKFSGLFQSLKTSFHSGRKRLSIAWTNECEEKEKILHDDRRQSTNNVEQGSCCSIVHCEVSAWKKSLLQREEGEEKLYCTATASKNESIGERTASA